MGDVLETGKDGRVRRRVWSGRVGKWVFATMYRYFCPVCQEWWGYSKGEPRGIKRCEAHRD